MAQTKKRIHWPSTLGVGLLPYPIKICYVEKLLKKRRRAFKDCTSNAVIIIIIIIIIIISAGSAFVELALFGYPD